MLVEFLLSHIDEIASADSNSSVDMATLSLVIDQASASVYYFESSEVFLVFP